MDFGNSILFQPKMMPPPQIRIISPTKQSPVKPQKIPSSNDALNQLIKNLKSQKKNPMLNVVDQGGAAGSDAYFGEWSQYNEPLSSHMDSQEMLNGGGGTTNMGRSLYKNQNNGSPNNNNRTFYKKDKNQAKNLIRSLHPTLRRGTEMTKSVADEMVNTEVQASPTDILTP
jgi:hypothetical protein